MKPLTFALALLALAACERSHSPAPTALARPTPPQAPPSAPAPPAANVAEAAANLALAPLPPDVDPDDPTAVFECRAAAAEKQGPRIAYGALEDPLEFAIDWQDDDPDFFSQTPQEKLALFRDTELHPGNPDGRPMNWDAVEAQEALQRALYYAVRKDAPQLITARDRAWLKENEKDLLETLCWNRGEAGVLFDIPKKACPPTPKG